MDGVISREIGKLQDWSFIGRSTNRRIGRFTGDARLFPHCQTLFIVHFFESLHGRLSNRRMASFHGRSANYRTGHLTDDRQIAGLGVSRGMLGSSFIVKRYSLFIFLSHCTAFHGGCWALPSLSNVSQGRAKSQGRAFHRRCQITGSRISREMAKSQGRAFHGRCQIAEASISRVASLYTFFFIVSFF